MDKRDERPITVVNIVKPEATFIIELPERAVRALAIIGDFGEGALENAVATVLSPMEAKRYSHGFTDLTRIGGVAHMALARLEDARAVADGRKVASDHPLKAAG
jgi:hypothetical protein